MVAHANWPRLPFALRTLAQALLNHIARFGEDAEDHRPLLHTIISELAQAHVGRLEAVVQVPPEAPSSPMTASIPRLTAEADLCHIWSCCGTQLADRDAFACLESLCQMVKDAGPAWFPFGWLQSGESSRMRMDVQWVQRRGELLNAVLNGDVMFDEVCRVRTALCSAAHAVSGT